MLAMVLYLLHPVGPGRDNPVVPQKAPPTAAHPLRVRLAILRDLVKTIQSREDLVDGLLYAF
jgi:hypothetical protein